MQRLKRTGRLVQRLILYYNPCQLGFFPFFLSFFLFSYLVHFRAQISRPCMHLYIRHSFFFFPLHFMTRLRVKFWEYHAADVAGLRCYLIRYTVTAALYYRLVSFSTRIPKY